MKSQDEATFLQVGVWVCLFGALTPLIDLALPGDGGAVDIVGDLVSTFALYLYVGLAFGLAVLRPGPLVQVAALLLLVDVLGPSFVAILDVPYGSEALLVVHVLAVLAFVAALTLRRDAVEVALAASAVGGAGLLTWAGFEGDEALRSVGLIVTGLGLAGLFHLARRAGWAPGGSGDVATWRRADLGIRIFTLGELGRIGLIALLFVGGIIARTSGATYELRWVATLGQLLIIVMSTVGLFAMRDAPAGRIWVVAALGLSLLALGSVMLELLAMMLGLDSSYAGLPVTGRQIAHVFLAALTALALGALGQRAGVSAASEDGRSIARAYAWLFVVTYTVLLLRDLGGPGALMGLLGLVLIVGTVISVRRIRALGERVRQALVGAAATEAFGEEELPAANERGAG